MGTIIGVIGLMILRKFKSHPYPIFGWNLVLIGAFFADPNYVIMNYKLEFYNWFFYSLSPFIDFNTITWAQKF